MKTKYKYLILIIVTILASVVIYNYVEENTSVVVNEDILNVQADISDEIASDTNYSISSPKVILNPYEISPLTALVVFKTNDLASATVTVKGKDNDEDIVNTFQPSKEHFISVYGLYPDYENTVIINCSGEETVLKIKTDKLPDGVKSSIAYENDSDDFYFTTSDDVNGFPVAYDSKGNVRWYLTKSYGFDFTRLSNGYILLGNSDLMKEPYYSSSLVEMDLLGKIYYEYTVPLGYHHDVYEKVDGNLIVLSNNSSMKEDVVIEIDRNTGEIVKNFNLSKLFNEDMPLTSVLYDGETNSILVTPKDKGMIINIDYNTGEINWIIGNENSVSDKYKKYLLTASNDVELPIRPEAITLVNGSKFAYVNTKNNENHLVVYSVNTSDRTFEEVDNYNLGAASKNSNLEYDNNSFIVTGDNTISILNDDELTTIMKASSNLYSAKATKMYAGDMFLLEHGQRLGTTGITPTVADHSVLLHKKDDSIFKQYNLDLSVDSKRLTVKGSFKKNDKVQIVLDNVLSKKTYDVDVLGGVETISGKMETSTYINKQGVYGKYYIYLKINGVNYKLGKYVMMS